jgi:RNA polymerase sigma factor for flagellar operon FliA
MHPERFVPTPEDLELLDRVARAVARARRLSPADVDDFAQTVHVRMAERGYHVLRQYEGRASLRTYLTVVLARQLKDWQNHEYGKWRPCAAARRAGPIATALDREVNRDGYPAGEAVRFVASQAGCPEADVQSVADALPRRAKRKLVGLDAAAGLQGVPFRDPLDDEQRGRALARARAALADALGGLPPAEARLFVERYVGRQTVAALAKTANVDAKALYRRFERIRQTLRVRVVAHGVCASPSAE